MRSMAVRFLLGTSLVAAFTSVLTLAAPAPAHAGDCYVVYIGTQATTVCPWQ